MSRVVRGSARPDASDHKAGTEVPRPRRGANFGERRFPAEKRAASNQSTCGGCWHWRAFANRWGRCHGDMIRHHVDGEGPLVTRDAFSCKFFAPARALDRQDITAADAQAVAEAG